MHNVPVMGRKLNQHSQGYLIVNIKFFTVPWREVSVYGVLRSCQIIFFLPVYGTAQLCIWYLTPFVGEKADLAPWLPT